MPELESDEAKLLPQFVDHLSEAEEPGERRSIKTFVGDAERQASPETRQPGRKGFERVWRNRAVTLPALLSSRSMPEIDWFPEIEPGTFAQTVERLAAQDFEEYFRAYTQSLDQLVSTLHRRSANNVGWLVLG